MARHADEDDVNMAADLGVSLDWHAAETPHITAYS